MWKKHFLKLDPYFLLHQMSQGVINQQSWKLFVMTNTLQLTNVCNSDLGILNRAIILVLGLNQFHVLTFIVVKSGSVTILETRCRIVHTQDKLAWPIGLTHWPWIRVPLIVALLGLCAIIDMASLWPTGCMQTSKDFLWLL